MPFLNSKVKKMKRYQPLDKKEVSIGMRVQNHNGLPGTVRFMGKWEKKDNPPNRDTGTYIGVEYDEPTESLSRTNGKWNDVQYFECPPGTAEFKKPKEYYPEVNTQLITELRKHFGERVAHMPDIQLIKFGIARKFSMDKVIIMIENHLKWAEKFKPSYDEYFPEGIKDDYPVGFSGIDRDNNLLYFEQPGNCGKCDPGEFVTKYGMHTIARWHVAGMETGKRLMKESGFRSKRVTVLVDLTKLGDMGRPMIKFAKVLSAIDQDNYPEHLARLFILNAPGFFTAIWKLVKFFLDDRTKEKIFILDKKEQRSVLLKYIREEDLPTFAGGKNDSWLKNGGRIGCTDPTKVGLGITEVAVVDDTEIAAAEAAASQASPQQQSEQSPEQNDDE
jgi:hypothetical protein